MNLTGMHDTAETLLRGNTHYSLEQWSRLALKNAEQEPARHQLALIKHLEELERGEISRLMLLLPPGSAKSTYASLLFPPWWLARQRQSSVITACHTAQLAGHFGRGVRGLIRDHGPALGISLREDSQAAHRFATEQGGEFFAVGVHGAVTGRRADLALIDDPVRSGYDASSLAARDKLWDWYRSDLVTRLKPRARIVLIMNRWHCDDLAGRLIEQGDWRVLRYPALAEADDPLERAPGEALWPMWEGRDALLQKQQWLGNPSFSALYQQAPRSDNDNLFNRSKIDLVDVAPPGTAVRAWDLAATAAVGNDPDWTVGLRLLRDEQGCFVVEDVIRLRAGAADVADRICDVARQDGPEVAVGLPQDPGQAGVAQVSFLTRRLAGFRIKVTPETGSKFSRADLVAAQANNGNLRLVRGAWNRAFLDELAVFPNGRKDDQVDALSRAFAMHVDTRQKARLASLSITGR